MSIAPIFKKWARGTLKSLLFSHYVVSDSFATLWTTALQAPLSMWFPRQEYWSGLPFPSPGNMSNQGIELASPALAGGFFFFFFTTEPPGKPILKSVNAQIFNNRIANKSWFIITMDYYGSIKVNKLQLHAITYMTLIGSKVYDPWISLAVLLLRLCTSTAGSIPGQETKTLHVKKKKKKRHDSPFI